MNKEDVESLGFVLDIDDISYRRSDNTYFEKDRLKKISFYLILDNIDNKITIDRYVEGELGIHSTFSGYIKYKTDFIKILELLSV